MIRYARLIALGFVAGCGAASAPATEPVGRTPAGKADSHLEGLPAADRDMEGVKRWARERTERAARDFSGWRMDSPGSWADEVVYQIQVDRFNDGDPSNNGRNVSSYQYDHRFRDQRKLDEYHHGGDLQGIINRLDYLANLGVSSLWLTPVLRTNGSYHGYCTSDFTRIDPQFGDARLLRVLTREAHRRGIRVVLDIVVNHICAEDGRTRYDEHATPFDSYHYKQCAADLDSKRWTRSESIRGQRKLSFGTFFPPLRHEAFYSRCGYKAGDFSSHGAAAVFGDFSSEMIDFNTMNWDFQEIFTELHKYWIAYADIDGFRIDAAKHVTEDFIATLSTNIRAYADSLGKHDFMLVGEVAASTKEMALRVGKMRSNWRDPGDSSAEIPETLRNRLKNLRQTYLGHRRFPYPGLNAVFDFAHSGITVDVMHEDRDPLAIKQWFWDGDEAAHDGCADSFCELAFNGDTALNWNILEIHDWPRMGQIEFGGDRPRALAQLSTALGYLLATRGVPVLYYGVEQGLDGNCPADSGIGLANSDARADVKHVCDTFEHTRYRQDMFVHGPWRLRSLVPAIDALAHIGFDNRPAPANWWDDPYLDRGHDLFRWVRKLIAIRRSCATLRRGEIYFRAAHAAPGGFFAFSRILEGRETLVLVNTGGEALPIETLRIDADIHRGADFSSYRNLLNGNQQATVGALDDGMGLYFEDFELAPHSVAIFAAADETGAYDSDLGAHRCRR